MSSTLRYMALAAMARMASAHDDAPAATDAASIAAAKLKSQARVSNQKFYDYIFVVLAALSVAFIFWRVGMESAKYVRTLACLNNETQTFFARPSKWYSTFKRQVLYAPLFSKRHNREIQLSAAMNVGTLPTRFQFVFLLGYFATNVAFCVLSIHWDGGFSTVCQEVRNRTGILSTVNMIPLFIMASRNNPLIKWLNLSFDTFNLLHRWTGRIVVLQAVAHVLAWGAPTVSTKGIGAAWASIMKAEFELMGFIAVVAFILITIQASSILRHAFYETFKIVHILLVITVIITLYYHLALVQLPYVTLVFGAIGVWVAERTMRFLTIVYRNVGNGGSRTLVEALPGNACRVTIDLARPWTFKPGQHAYLYMPSVGWTTSHPFSVAWSEETENLGVDEKLAMTKQDVLAAQKTSISFVIRARTGFTSALFKKAESSTDGRFYTKCFAEGPYGGMHMMHSYGTVMLVAGGVGITHQVPHVRDLVAGYANGTVAARKIVLVWVIQSPEHLEWIRPWMTAILAMDKRREVLRIMLFVSRPRSTKEIHSPSETVQMFPGRPNLETLIDMELQNQVGAMGVSVCGAGALSDDVRAAVRSRQHAGNIDFVEEAFSW